MASRPALITQSEVTRYAKGLMDAGVKEYRIVVRPDGSHEIIAGKTASLSPGPTGWEDCE